MKTKNLQKKPIRIIIKLQKSRLCRLLFFYVEFKLEKKEFEIKAVWEQMGRKLLLRWSPTIVILGFIVFIILEKYFCVHKETVNDFLITMIFLLIVLPIIFLLQGMYSYYFNQNIQKNYVISLGIWMVSSLIVAPEANSIYVFIYSICFWLGVLITWLFKRTYVPLGDYDASEEV